MSSNNSSKKEHVSLDLLQQQLKESLADALYMQPADIDINKSFVDIGLDSIVGVEWVSRLNKQYKLSISATRVYDYSNIRELALFLQREIKDKPVSIDSKTVDGTSSPIAPGPALSDKPKFSISHKAPSLEPQHAKTEPYTTLTSYPTLKRRARPTLGSRPEILSTTDAPSTGDYNKVVDKVAIIGMSGRYPQASNLQEYWDNLVQGKNSIVEIPPSRWDVEQYYDPQRLKKGKVYSKWLGMLDDVEFFDPLFFQISPAEAEVMDPQHRLFMQESYRAFEHAGYSNEALSNIKCGVYLGIMSSEYSLMLSKLGSASVDTTGNSFAIGAARIAYYLNLKGPAIPVDTACSSSLVTIHLACQGLLNNEIDMALAGGVSLYLTPESYVGMCQAGMLSADGQCKTFDDSADGFVPGEGVGAVILKRLKDAERDKDFIYGIILGSAINQDGKTNGITAPSVNSQIELESDLYSRHNIDPGTISYVETHGTGTKLGDPIELEALRTVFERKTSKKNYCALGSVKSNIGHTSGAAGVASVQKVLLSMRHRMLVPSLNIKKENNLFNFQESPFYISKNKQAWETEPGSARRAAVSSFGFSGTNAHLVLEEYLGPEDRNNHAPDSLSKGDVIIPLSAKSEEQLLQQATNLLGYLSSELPAGIPIGRYNPHAIAYTLQVGRTPMRERLAFVVKSVQELKESLQRYIAGTPEMERCFRGEANSNSDMMSLFGSDADFRDTIDKWVASRQHSKLANLWVKGLNLDWNKLHGAIKPGRIGLPTYPFAKQRYWIDPVLQEKPMSLENEKAKPYRHAQQITEKKGPLYYVTNWKEVPLPDLESGHAVDKEEVVLALYPSDELLSSLNETLNSAIWVESGESFRRISDNHYCLGNDLGEDILQLVRELIRKRKFPSRVLHCCFDDEESSVEPLQQRMNKGIYTLFHLFKALMKQKHAEPVNLISIFNSEAGYGAPENEALASFCQTLTLENPKYQARVLQICANREEKSDFSIHDLVETIYREFSDNKSRLPEVRYQYNRQKQVYSRYIKKFSAYTPSRDIKNIPLKQKGVYLVTGGLGGLGYKFSEYLAKNFQARLILTGRSSLDGELKAKYESLLSLGTEVIYLQADVSELEDMKEVLKEVKNRFSTLNGVIHSAGINKDAFLLKKTKHELDEVIKPKVDGTVVLDEVTKDEAIDLFVMFSSVASAKGNLGQCDYAYANQYMDSFAHHRSMLVKENLRSGKTLSINWPLWEEGGMTIRKEDIELTEKHTGMSPMPTQIGIQFWEEYICSEVTQGLAFYGLPSKIETYLNPVFDKAGKATVTAGRMNRPATHTLVRDIEVYLKGLLSEEIKLEAEKVDLRERFETYGVDSIVIGRLNARLQQDFGELPKTLFYEYETTGELARYLAKEGGNGVADYFNAIESEPPTEVDFFQSHGISSSEISYSYNESESEEPEQFAIVGMHAIFPGSEGLEQYWNNLKEGKDLTGLVPSNRWDYSEFYDGDPEKSTEGKIYCKWGGFIDCFDKFDPSFFNISQEDANIIDPQERLFLQSVWSAIEDAGYTRTSLRNKYPKSGSADVGVYVGVTTNTYNLLAPEQWLKGNSVSPSAMPWSIANRISYFFDFKGPSMPIDTACSSSLVALHLACESLKRKDCQIAVVGGVNLYLHPAKYQSLCRKRMVSLTGKTCSYGLGDDGFVPGEGVGSLLIKPLAKAVEDGDHIYAVVAGSEFDHAGRSNGYSAPNPNSQASLISRTLEKAQVHPESIGYIEGHGTGTQLGDSLEIVALSQAFRRHTEKKQICPIGSVKANIGHSESAAGIAGIVKVLLQIKYRQLVPSIHSREVNPNIDFAESPFYPQHQTTPWDSAFPRIALINSFGAGGVNACVLLKEFEPKAIKANSNIDLSEGPKLIILSAKTSARLHMVVARLIDHLRQEDIDMARLSYTLQVGREAMSERVAIVCSDKQDLLKQLANCLQKKAGLSEDQIFQNSVAANSSASRFLNKSEAAQVDSFIESHNLFELAKMWVNGKPIDWERLYPDGGLEKLSLPTYPFEQQRCWITEGTIAGERVEHRQQSKLHPLVSYNTSTLKMISFQSELSNTKFYAKDHRINGKMMFPGAGFLEIACVCGNIAAEQKVAKIKDIVWIKPLLFQQDTAFVQTFMKAVGNDVEFEITSLDCDSERIVFSEGRIVFHSSKKDHFSSEPQISIESLKQACPNPQDGGYLYRRFNKSGFGYGPGFQSIQEFYTDGSFALSRLKLAAYLEADFEGFILHPSLLDGALQTVIGLMDKEKSDNAYLPFALDEVEIIKPLSKNCYAYVEPSNDGNRAQKDIKKFNIQLLSEYGDVLVRINNFYVRMLDSGVIDQQKDSDSYELISY